MDFSSVLSAVPDHAAKLQRLSQIHIQQQVAWIVLTALTSREEEPFVSGCTDSPVFAIALIAHL